MQSTSETVFGVLFVLGLVMAVVNGCDGGPSACGPDVDHADCAEQLLNAQ